ncbi:MAG TPA: hypothetical protein VHG28_13095 [Longimicrobiaceae bacterium]|nr:hypothetical protein [Longimicrobiaceae bacterium]
MIDTATATLEEIRRAGVEALRRELGVVGMVRFLQQFETGTGDYTEERQQFVGKAGVRALAEQIQNEQADRRSA